MQQSSWMRVDFIYFDAGGGHRAAANALRQVIEQQKRPFEIRMVNLQEVLDAMDVFRKLTGLRLQDIYNLMLKKGWTLGSPQLMVGMHWVIRLFHSRTVRLLEDFWREHRPEMVVSLVPNLDRALCESLARALPGVPFVTILTDIADYPPHFWIEKQVQHFICGSAKAVEQARSHGPRRRQGASRFRDDPESAVLRDRAAFGRRTGGRARRVGLRPVEARRAGAVRRRGLRCDARDREAGCPTGSCC